MAESWTRIGAEQGKTFIVVRALYGLKSASAAFRSLMASKLDEIGFKSSNADPDVWLGTVPIRWALCQTQPQCEAIREL